MHKTKLLAALVLACFMFTMAPLSANADSKENKKQNNQNSYQCSADERTELAQFQGEQAVAQQAYWDAEESIRLLKIDIKNTEKALKKAKGKQKTKLNNDLKEYNRLLKIDQKKFWNAEGKIKWYKAEIKKLEKKIKEKDKDCDNNYGYGHNNGNDDHGNAWWKNWGNWFHGNANAWWN